MFEVDLPLDQSQSHGKNNHLINYLDTIEAKQHSQAEALIFLGTDHVHAERHDHGGDTKLQPFRFHASGAPV